MLDVERILRLVKEKGYTENAVCKALRWGNGAISRWTENVPSVDKIFKLSKFMGVSVASLLEESDAETQPIKAIADNHSIANVHGTINGASAINETEKNIVFEQGEMRLVFPKDTPQDIISSTVVAAAYGTIKPARTALTLRFLGPVATIAGRGLELCFTRLVDGKQDKNEIAKELFAAFREWEKEFEQYKFDKLSEDIVSI